MLKKIFLGLTIVYGLTLTPASLAGEPLIDQELIVDSQAQTLTFLQSAGLSLDVTVEDVVSAVLLIFFSLLGVIFTCLIIYGGYTWLNAQGEEEKIRKAKGIIRNSLWGIVYIVGAYALAYFILQAVTAGVTTNTPTTTGAP